MGRKKFKNNFVDFRGRWVDNQKLLRKVVDYARKGEDWTVLLKHILIEGKGSSLGKVREYRYPPDLRCAKFDNFNLDYVVFNHVDLSKSTLFRVDADSFKLSFSNATSTKWFKSNLRHSVFMNCNLSHSNFACCNMEHSVFINCNLNHVYFRKANLSGAKFIDCDLRHTNLNEVTLHQAVFENVKLYGASLWELKYDLLVSNNIDLSKSGNNGVVTDDIRCAPLIYLLEDDKLVEVINTLKSNTVVILGADNTDGSISVLERIARKSRELGYTPIIVKNLKEIGGESFTKKAVMYSLIAKFVIAENSMSSGHILEFSKVLDLGCIVGVLQNKGAGSTWLLEENFIKYPFHLKRFTYEDNIDEEIERTFFWCIKQCDSLRKKLDQLYSGLNLTTL